MTINSGGRALLDYDHDHSTGSQVPLELGTVDLKAGGSLGFAESVPANFVASFGALKMYSDERIPLKSNLEIGDFGIRLGSFNGTKYTSVYPGGISNPLSAFFGVGFQGGTSSEDGFWSSVPGGDSTKTIGVVAGDLYRARYISSGIALWEGFDVQDSDVLIRSTWLADADLDQKVDIRDLYLLAIHYDLGHVHTGILRFYGDFNFDTFVDAGDLSILSAQWQFGVTGGGMSFSTARALYGL